MARREFQDPSVLVREGKQGAEWYFRYRIKRLVDGQIKRIEKWQVLGLCSKMTKHQAGRRKGEILREVNGQVFTVQSQVPFSTVLQQFRENHLPALAVPSQKTYAQHIHAYIEPVWGKARLCEIGTLQVEQLLAGMARSGLSQNTRKTTKGILKAIWGCARKWGYTTENPIRGAEIGGGPRKVRECRIPTLEDVARLMDATEGDVPLLIETLYTTGMRISEAAGLTVDHLDFARNVAVVNRRNCRGDIDQTKSEPGRRDLGLGDVAAKLMGHVQGKRLTDPVFTWKREPIVDNQLLGKYLTPIMEKLGMKFAGFGWHTFRRLHLTLMGRRGGLSLFDLRRQAGHADVRTTQRYIADDLHERTAATDALPKLRLVKGA